MLRTLFTREPRYEQLTQYDLNGIAASAWQRVQSRALAERSLEHQYPHLFIDPAAEATRLEAARATEQLTNQAISATEQLLTSKESFQAEAPILDMAAARGSTVAVMEQMATADLVTQQTAAEAATYTAEQGHIMDLQRRIAEIRSLTPQSQVEFQEVTRL